MFYDPFEMMKATGKKYGYALSMQEGMNTIPTLWKSTKEYLKLLKGGKIPEHMEPFLDQDTGQYSKSLESNHDRGTYVLTISILNNRRLSLLEQL
jgi:hypothetical protein